MATIRKRAQRDGTIRWQAQVRRSGSKHLAKTFTRKSDAEVWVREMERSLDLGEFAEATKASQTTFSQLLDQYLDEGVVSSRGDRKIAKSDRGNRRRQLEWWRQRLGKIQISRLTPTTVLHEIRSLSKKGPAGRPLSSATKNRYLSAISTVLTWAVRQRRFGLSRNPLIGAALRGEESRGLDRILNVEEQAALVQAAERDEHSRIALWILLGLATGARQGELAQLRWSEVSLVDQTAEVPRHAVLTFYRTKNSDPKVVVLGEGKALVELEDARSGRRSASELVLATQGGHAGSQKVTFPKRAWARVQRAADLTGTGVVFHTLRHTNASLLLQSGCTLAEIGQELGHRSPDSTQRYVHLAKEHARTIAQRLSRFVDW